MNKRIKLLIIITDKKRENSITNILKKLNIKDIFIKKAKGTASSSLLDYFGIEESKRQIILAIIPEYLEYDIYKSLFNKLIKPGTGIGITIPITSSNRFLSDYEWEGSIKKMPKSNKSLIITIANEGYYEEIMNAAKSNGATGGTLLRSKSLQTTEVSKLLGISISPEKDIVLIVANDDIKNNIMNAINEKVNMNNETKGIIFSLPVDSALGFNDENI